MRREGEQLVLDTNILLYWLRGGDAGHALRVAFELGTRRPRPVIPIVVHGELRAIAEYRNWGPEKLERLAQLLAELPAVDVVAGPIVDAYGTIDAASTRAGRSMGKNDVWIAAITSVLGGVLLTTDADFDHLAGSTIAVERLATPALLAGRIESP